MNQSKDVTLLFMIKNSDPEAEDLFYFITGNIGASIPSWQSDDMSEADIRTELSEHGETEAKINSMIAAARANPK